MIQIHPRFRSETEALEAANDALEAARDCIVEPAAWRVAVFTHELIVGEVTQGYAGPYKRVVAEVATCTCAVCVSRREAGEP